MTGSGTILREENYHFTEDGRLDLISSPQGTIHYASSPTGQLTDTWTESGSGVSPLDPSSSTT